jgi:hypothetical protein
VLIALAAHVDRDAVIAQADEFVDDVDDEDDGHDARRRRDRRPAANPLLCL